MQVFWIAASAGKWPRTAILCENIVGVADNGQYVHYAVVSLSEIDSQLAEIDENLVRNELNTLERCEQFARRKELYEAKYPLTKRGTAGAHASNKAQDNATAESAVASFTEDTAAKTNVAARTIREDVQIATRIPEQVRDARLIELEAVVEKGLETFYEVGTALMEIRATPRYYKTEFGTFENYCRSRWRMSRSYAHRLMESASVVDNLLPTGNTPDSERQTREIASFSGNAELQQAVWQVAQATACCRKGNQREISRIFVKREI
jgi:hypothetical protein